jgi:hypothetical protein
MEKEEVYVDEPLNVSEKYDYDPENQVDLQEEDDSPIEEVRVTISSMSLITFYLNNITITFPSKSTSLANPLTLIPCFTFL